MQEYLYLLPLPLWLRAIAETPLTLSVKSTFCIPPSYLELYLKIFVFNQQIQASHILRVLVKRHGHSHQHTGSPFAIHSTLTGAEVRKPGRNRVNSSTPASLLILQQKAKTAYSIHNYLWCHFLSHIIVHLLSHHQRLVCFTSCFNRKGKSHHHLLHDNRWYCARHHRRYG